ncbi:uncharacterized protein Dwil_GK19083 [Drosophila willistoni]|uniref:Uncharacterized protein n=1 Tax=Drosophila willistoni TaxID=7260 RepID=B4MTP4_DROWI|nr:uncharacterized protein LOC6641713 [Drosophila willistoni]EDW75483.1 uncharacterized protein Dwil_GK19083 [Drosophila willistoni]
MCTLRLLTSSLFQQRPFYLTVNRLASCRSFPVPLANADGFDVDEMRDQKFSFDPCAPILCNRSSDLFFMPRSVGPAYHGLMTTADDFAKVSNNSFKHNGKKSHKEMQQLPLLQIIVCPRLLSLCIEDVFTHSNGVFVDVDNYCILNLYFDTDINSAIKQFVLKATQYSLAIAFKGYWADFINPFTGRPNFHQDKRKANEVKTRLFHNMDINKTKPGCTIMEETPEYSFIGTIVTDAPYSVMQSWWHFPTQ